MNRTSTALDAAEASMAGLTAATTERTELANAKPDRMLLLAAAKRFEAECRERRPETVTLETDEHGTSITSTMRGLGLYEDIVLESAEAEFTAALDAADKAGPEVERHAFIIGWLIAATKHRQELQRRLWETEKVVAKRMPNGYWEAWREDDVDPEGFTKGSGDTEAEALADLREQLAEAAS